jgi:splicing factor 3A subunit 2
MVLGTYSECKLCLTQHTNEGSYLTHTQGQKHQSNLKRRAQKDTTNQTVQPLTRATQRQQIHRVAVKIGRTGYKVAKVRDASNQQNGLLFQIYFLKSHRFMSSSEQRIDTPSKYHQYLLFAAEPYETIALKIQSLEIDKAQGF